MAGVLALCGAAIDRAGEHASEVAHLAADVADRLGVAAMGAVIGKDCALAADAVARSGVLRVLTCQSDGLAPYLAETWVEAALDIVARLAPEIILVPHDGQSMEWAPALAARLQAAPAMNCSSLRIEDGGLLAVRPMCGGAVLGEIAFNRKVVLATIALRAFAARRDETACPIEAIEWQAPPPRLRVIEEIPEAAGTGRPLKGARVVVAGGLGVGGQSHWALIEQAAAALDGAVGATRAVVELGWVPVSRQVGFSGQKVAPELYVAAGLSGALHHLAGIDAARNVVAINKDGEAPIFRRARFGIVGDVKEALPAFTARVRELRNKELGD